MKLFYKIPVLTVTILILHQPIYSKNMDLKHLHNTCFMEAAIHALSKVDEMNDKLRAAKNLDPKSLPGLYIKLVDQIKDKWSESKKVFMGNDKIIDDNKIETGVTLEDFYKRLAPECGNESYGNFADSFQVVNNFIEKINPENIKCVRFDELFEDDRSPLISNFINIPTQSSSISNALEQRFNNYQTRILKLPKILVLRYIGEPQSKKLDNVIKIKKDRIASDLELEKFNIQLDPETKTLKNLNCNLAYELFVIGTATPGVHWWVYAKDIGPNGQWYKYDNYHDNDGEVKHFTTLKDIESDFGKNDYPEYFFYRLSDQVKLQLNLAQLKNSLSSLKNKLTSLKTKLGLLQTNF